LVSSRSVLPARQRHCHSLLLECSDEMVLGGHECTLPAGLQNEERRQRRVSGGNMQTRKTGRSWGRRRIRHPRKLVPHQLGNRQVAAYSRVVYTANVYGNTSITAPVRLVGERRGGDEAQGLPSRSFEHGFATHSAQRAVKNAKMSMHRPASQPVVGAEKESAEVRWAG
jgi:hypothetical protein